MTTVHHTSVLNELFQTCQQQIPQLTSFRAQKQDIDQQAEKQQLQSLIHLYHQLYPLVEQLLWHGDEFESVLNLYQRLFKEQEALIEQDQSYQRHDFILSIPIADRPEHLRGSLESIYQLCQLYGYGGKQQGCFSRVRVIIIEDSKEKIHIDKDIELAREYTGKGLKVYHFGQQEQRELMQTIPKHLLTDIRSIIGEPDSEKFYHKGQAVTRNLAYLKALQISPDKEHSLYYFVDSDQQFRVNRTTSDGDQFVYGLNYFYYINYLFKHTDIDMLTGKLVCDPPVSPSVMTANFLDDVIVFFEQLSQYKAQQDCQFHPKMKVKPDDAAYHDMAQLFGLKSQQKTYDYCCSLKSAHDHISCLNSFAQRLNYFFFGEHLTRKTYFSYAQPFTEITPARTIYPGNYITTFAGLKYIIPFGPLRLRMSGPTAGRLIQSEINTRFASVNLPMLHARTLQTNFDDEYRPGVEDNSQHIDLSNEFERQFFGDLMLFSVDRLLKEGVAISDYTESLLEKIFARIEQELLLLYQQKHQKVSSKCAQLDSLVNNHKHWWHQHQMSQKSIAQVNQFIKNVRYNFDEQGSAYQNIQSKKNRQQKIEQMIQALLTYRHDRNAWDEMLLTFTG